MDREHVKYVKAVGDLAQDSEASEGRAASREPRAKRKIRHAPTAMAGKPNNMNSRVRP
jgi:hypothetical protein